MLSFSLHDAELLGILILHFGNLQQMMCPDCLDFSWIFVLFCFKVVLSWKLDFSQLFNMSFCATGLVTGTARMKNDNLMNMLQIILLKQEFFDLNVRVASLLES